MFWITFLFLNYIKCSRESEYGTIVRKLKSAPYCGEGGKLPLVIMVVSMKENAMMESVRVLQRVLPANNVTW